MLAEIQLPLFKSSSNNDEFEEKKSF